MCSSASSIFLHFISIPWCDVPSSVTFPKRRKTTKSFINSTLGELGDFLKCWVFRSQLSINSKELILTSVFTDCLISYLSCSITLVCGYTSIKKLFSQLQTCILVFMPEEMLIPVASFVRVHTSYCTCRQFSKGF